MKSLSNNLDCISIQIFSYLAPAAKISTVRALAKREIPIRNIAAESAIVMRRPVKLDMLQRIMIGTIRANVASQVVNTRLKVYTYGPGI